MTITEFLLARIAEDEERIKDAPEAEKHPESSRSGWYLGHECPICGIKGFGGLDSVVEEAWYEHMEQYHQRSRVLAECEAKRRIVELHEAWPVLVETPVQFQRVETPPSAIAFQAAKRIQWLTQQEYRARFGDKPPTAPMLRALAAVYADHPDYREEWRP